MPEEAADKHSAEPTAAHQQKQIEAVTAGLQKVSAQLEASKPAPQVAENNRFERTRAPRYFRAGARRLD